MQVNYFSASINLKITRSNIDGSDALYLKDFTFLHDVKP